MKILVVRLSSLGDILHFFPAISDLHSHLPEAQIHWLVEPAFAEVAGWHFAVDKVITVPLRSNKKTWWKIPVMLLRLRRQLLAENYSIVLDAQGLIKSAILARLAGNTVYGFATGSARESLAARFYTKRAVIQQGIHIIDKNRQLVSKTFNTDISQPADFGLKKFREQQLLAGMQGKLQRINGRLSIVLLHGTTWNSKYWPEASWEELIDLLSQQGWNCLLPWGNEEERQRAYRLQAIGGESVQVLPKLTLTEMMRLTLHARAFVSVESGIGHIAAALNIAGIMLHGPTDPSYSGVLGKSCRHITSGIFCSPCFKRNCPRINSSDEIPPCQQTIQPIEVYRQCLAMLASPEATAV